MKVTYRNDFIWVIYMFLRDVLLTWVKFRLWKACEVLIMWTYFFPAQCFGDGEGTYLYNFALRSNVFGLMSTVKLIAVYRQESVCPSLAICVQCSPFPSHPKMQGSCLVPKCSSPDSDVLWTLIHSTHQLVFPQFRMCFLQLQMVFEEKGGCDLKGQSFLADSTIQWQCGLVETALIPFGVFFSLSICSRSANLFCKGPHY